MTTDQSLSRAASGLPIQESNHSRQMHYLACVGGNWGLELYLLFDPTDPTIYYVGRIECGCSCCALRNTVDN